MSNHTVSNRKMLPTVLNFMDGSRVLSRENSSYDTFDLLRRAVHQRRRIEVLIRDCRGICGILIGWLIVFDKHMNLVMSDVDEVFRRLTDGQDYLQLGPTRRNLEPIQSKTPVATTDKVPEDFHTFRAQLANFLRNRKSKATTTVKPKIPTVIDDNEEDDNDDTNEPECHPEQFLSMELLNATNLTVQRLDGQSTDFTSKRAKVRFFSRHIPKLFVKGNQVCLVRLL